MIEKTVALGILQEISSQLTYDNWREAQKTVDTYIKNLEIATNEKIKKLINKHTVYCEKYGEDSFRTKILARKINRELSAIYNKNY